MAGAPWNGLVKELTERTRGGEVRWIRQGLDGYLGVVGEGLATARYVLVPGPPHKLARLDGGEGDAVVTRCVLIGEKTLGALVMHAEGQCRERDRVDFAQALAQLRNPVVIPEPKLAVCGEEIAAYFGDDLASATVVATGKTPAEATRAYVKEWWAKQAGEPSVSPGIDALADAAAQRGE